MVPVTFPGHASLRSRSKPLHACFGSVCGVPRFGACSCTCFQMHDTAQLDFENRLIELNPHGRMQTKKIRPIVKMPETLALVLEGAPNDHLITYKGKPVKCVRTAWRNLRDKCGLDDAVQPYSLRHTMARWLRKSGVSAWETAAQLGHKSREHRTTEIYAPFAPDYLTGASEAIDSYFGALRANYAPVPKRYFQPEIVQVTDVEGKSGAGDESPHQNFYIIVFIELIQLLH